MKFVSLGTKRAHKRGKLDRPSSATHERFARPMAAYHQDLQRRPRTDYTRAVRAGAPSDLHRASDGVRRNRDRAWARGRNHSHALSVHEHLDQTAARRKTHAPEIPRPIRCVSTPRETPDTFHHLAFSYMYEKNNCSFEDCSCFPGFESLAVASHPLQLIRFLESELRDQINQSKQKRD
jgi:hypothetical protein